MLELTVVRWLLAELGAGRLTLAAAEEYAARAATPARPVLGPLPSPPVLLAGEVPLPIGDTR